MPTPTVDKLSIHYASRHLAADGDALTQYTLGSGTVRALVAAALTQATGYWDGAVGWFDGDTLTVALRGAPFHVRSFDGGTDTLTLARDLQAAPQAGDTFRLALGGNRRSSQEAFGMVIGGVSPEFTPVACATVTGVTINKASAGLGAVDVHLDYDATEETLAIRIGSGGAPGPALDVSGNLTGAVLMAADDLGYMIVDVVSASLPVADETEVLTLTYPQGLFCPDFEGYETAGTGKVRYRLEVCRNTDPADSMIDLSVHAPAPPGTATVVAAGESLTTAAGTLAVVGGSDWPTRSFWVRNTTVNGGAGDCRYVKYRSGATLYCAAADGWARLAFATGVAAPTPGDVVTGATSGATGRVVSVQVDSGSWGTADAAGSFILSEVTGAFTSGEQLQVGASTCAGAAGADVKGLRGCAATTWGGGDAVEVMPDVDLGVETPGGGNVFSDPAGESLAPAGVAFSAPAEAESALSLGDLAPAAMRGVWRREWIMDGHRARSAIIADTVYGWS